MIWFWVGLFFSVLISYLGIGHVRRWVTRTFGREAEWWFDALRLILIPVAAIMTVIGYIQAQDARRSAEQSLQNADKKIEALSPSNKPIMTASCSVAVAASFKRTNPFEHPALQAGGPQGILRFVGSDSALLELTPRRIITSPYKSEIDIHQSYYNEINMFQLNFALLAPQKNVRDLRDTQVIAVNSGGISEGAQIYEGKGRCSINSVIEFDFVILPQIVNQHGYFLVSDVSPLLEVLQ